LKVGFGIQWLGIRGLSEPRDNHVTQSSLTNAE
jgi:hypothetical protein